MNKSNNEIFVLENYESEFSYKKNKYELVLLDYNYLTTPKKLMEYQSKYFENDLIFLDITKIKKIKEKNDELTIIEPNKRKMQNE